MKGHPLTFAALLTAAGVAVPSDLRAAGYRDRVEADWLRQAEVRFAAAASEVSRARDAAGAVDGVIDGQWGFHTALEATPWWQVDLGAIAKIDRVVLYNRVGDLAARAARVRVLISDTGPSFRQVYEHDGTPFQGYSDGKPLVISLNGQSARYLRLQLPEQKIYFHLDEVQVYAVSDKTNIALGKPATQSSVSQWSKNHGSAAAMKWEPVVRTTLERGLQLARALANMGGDTREAVGALSAMQQRLATAAPPPSGDDLQQRYLDARRIIRHLALSNPLLDFDTLLFVKRAPSMFPHQSDQYYGWWSRPGGGVYLLENFKGDDAPSEALLTGALPPGNALRPDLSCDGKRVLFAYARYRPDVASIENKVNKDNLPEDAFYHLYEIHVDGSGLRRLTHGKYDDFDGRYLPGGDVAFLSTRKGTFLQCTQANTRRTQQEHALPDSYVRCGGGNARPVPVFTLHAMDADGGNMRPISAFETFEYTPSVAHDGRILYCRWDYIDRFNGHFFSLWSTHPDGSTAQLVYGNYTTRPQVTAEPRAIPGSRKIIFTASAHHSIVGGSLVLLDPDKGMENEAPITRLTPEVPFPETERNVGMYYANPWPLSEDFYLVSWSDRKLPPHCRCADDESNPENAQGLYLYDRFGNLELLYRDPKISCMTPIPVRSRPEPPAYPNAVPNDEEPIGSFLVQSVYEGLGSPTGSDVARIRIVGVPPKVQPQMNTPGLGVSCEETGKYILGSAPVERDGSAYFRVPSGVPVFFQLLDPAGRAVQTMRSLTYVQPGQTLSCIGCHEHRNSSPQNDTSVLALRRAPSPLRPGPPGALPLRYDALVQPVLDEHCVRCHSPANRTSPGGKVNLTAPASYKTLLDYAGGDLRGLVFERDYSTPYRGPALESKLLKHLAMHPAHRSLRMTDSDRRRIYAWMDIYGHTQGCFSPGQERELVAWIERYNNLFTPATISDLDHPDHPGASAVSPVTSGSGRALE